MFNPTISHEDAQMLNATMFTEEQQHPIPFVDVLNSYKITEDEFDERLSDAKTVTANAMSNIDKAEKALKRALEKYEIAQTQLNDESIEISHRASQFFAAQASVNSAINSLNIQRANAYYVLTKVVDDFKRVDSTVHDKLSDFSDKF